MILAVITLLTASVFPQIQEEGAFVETFTSLTTPNGLVRDRLSDADTISVASTGLVSYAKAIAISKDTLPESEKQAIVNGFRNTLRTNPKENRGWLFHFTDCNGVAKEYSEVSTIDSAIFYYSYLKVGEVLGDTEFTKEVQLAIGEIDISYAMVGDRFHHGWLHGKQIEHIWDDWDEGVILYDLFGKTFAAEPTFDLPLFVYYYPLCFTHDEKQVFILQNAIAFQHKTYGRIGITACDGPDGYQVGRTDVISPLSIYACSRYSTLARQYMPLLPVSRLVASYSDNWRSSDKLGIDYASCYIILNKYQPLD